MSRAPGAAPAEEEAELVVLNRGGWGSDMGKRKLSAANKAKGAGAKKARKEAKTASSAKDGGGKKAAAQK
jgi:hypothetical protein